MVDAVQTPDATASASEPAAAPRRKRVPAPERRADVLREAIEVVARDGMHGASTAEIARRAGISHAYLFRLFPSKDELMIAVSHEAGHRMHERMVGVGEAAKARGEDPLEAMGAEWVELLRDRTMLRVSLQAIAAAELIPALGEHLRASWERVITDIERISGADPDRVREFVAEGMLLKIIAGLGAEQSDWATRLHHGPLPCGNDGSTMFGQHCAFPQPGASATQADPAPPTP